MRVPVAGVSTYCYTGTRPLDAAQPTVVLAHGAAHDHSVWSLQSRALAHHGHNVLAVDLPGHGRSEGEPLADVGALADWLVALLDAVGVPTAALAGHSMGALAVLEAAARHPTRVRKIALLGPAVPMAVSDDLLDAARRADPVALELIVGWSHAPAALLGGHPVPGLWMRGGALRLLERARPGVLATDLAACAAYAGGLDAAARVACPALVLVGDRDLMAPAQSAQPLIEALRDVRVQRLADCGHAMTVEAPGQVLDALAAFL